MAYAQDKTGAEKIPPINIDSVITYQSMYKTVATLADDSMQGRRTGSTGAKDAAVFIAKRFEAAGLKSIAGNDKYFSYYATIEGYPADAINVLGALKTSCTASLDTIVIFCAHYDHIGRKRMVPDGEDNICNGANDNASGISMLIELANYYAAVKKNKYTLLFIAFSGEEMGELGSTFLNRTLDSKKVVAVINFDMEGRQIEEAPGHCMVIAETANATITKLNRQLGPWQQFFISDQFPGEKLEMRTDSYSFRQVKNCFSIMCSSPTDKYYHTVSDETSTIDFDFLLRSTKKVAVACETFTD